MGLGYEGKAIREEAHLQPELLYFYLFYIAQNDL